MSKKRFFKNEKGSVTLYILLAGLFLTVALVGVNTYMKNREIAVNEQYKKIKGSYEENVGNEGKVYIDAVSIDELPQGWDEDNLVNSPKLLDGMTAVYWDENGTEVSYYNKDGTVNANFDVDKWYNYAAADETKAGTTEGDTKSSNWANSKTEDGSMWVWVPRFAYKITSTTTDYTKAGTIDVVFLKGTTNKDANNVEYDMPSSADDDTTAKYVVHPAFCGTGYEDLGGGFGSTEDGITGFWVSKYEMSMEGSTDGTNWISLSPNTYVISTTAISGNVATTDTITQYNKATGANLTTSVVDGTTTYTNIRAVSKSNAKGWRYINISNAYENAYYYDREKDSHLMKNSEWGALAYLTHSKYGRNGNEVERTTSDISGSKGETASTTGNQTGTYELNGGSFEYVAAFNTEYLQTGKYYSTNNTLYCSATGRNMGVTGLGNKRSTKYLTQYSNATSSSTEQIIKDVSKIGDAMKEVWVNTYYSWFSDNINMLNTSSPFCMRGGPYHYGSSAGSFFSYSTGGESHSTGTFRVCLIDEVDVPEEDWVLAEDTNTINDWYEYTDSNGNTATVNEPKLADGMSALKYETSNTELVQGSKWANAMTKDGSMWVWIPRFAYQIPEGYHKSGADLNSTDGTLGAGTINIAFLKDNTNEFLDSSITGTVVSGTQVTEATYADTSKWILAPAFTLGTEELTGFWFAKFEASNTNEYGDDGSTANNASLTLQIKPNKISWRRITAANMFTVCRELTSDTIYSTYFNKVDNVDTHMTKNVEWGAVAYLAHSTYGLNGKEICINTSSIYKTGLGSGSTNSASSSSTTDEYNTELGITASTTKNVYGVYDMSGCSYEYVAACLNGYTSKLTAQTDATYINKYIDIYSSYSNSKYGDAIYETSSASTEINAWFKDYTTFMDTSNPILMRGGFSDDRSIAGLFSFYYYNGNAGSVAAFRPVCVVK